MSKNSTKSIIELFLYEGGRAALDELTRQVWGEVIEHDPTWILEKDLKE